MCLLDDWLTALRHMIRTGFRVLLDFLGLAALTFRSRSAVEAENLFLRKQLALFQKRKTKPRRADDSTRWLMSFLSRVVQLAQRFGRGPARDTDSMASQRFPFVLPVAGPLCRRTSKR